MVKIGDREIGENNPVYIIAEISANHKQSYDEAVRLVLNAKQCGADAVKTQTYTPETLTIKCGKPEFLISGGTLWDNKTLYDLYSEAYMPWEWNDKLKNFANELHLDYITTVYDKTSVDYMEKLNPVAYKIASFEMTDTPFIDYVATKGRTMLVSTGMATLDEIYEAVTAIQRRACPLVLLKCNSGYPAKFEEMNLVTISDLSKTLGIPIGFSDHTLGITAPIVAVTLGACVIEKHFTLDRKDKTPDSAFSLEPEEFAEMVKCVREAEKCVGEVSYEPTPEELKSIKFRRSVYVVRDIDCGEMFTEENIRSIRPSGGVEPSFLPWALGKTAKRALERGTPLNFNDIKMSG